MERRKALAAASAATLILGSTIVAGASVTGASFLGFGIGSHSSGQASGAPDPGFVVKTRNVYDRYVVVTPDSTQTGEGAANRPVTSSRAGSVSQPAATTPTVANPEGNGSTPPSRPHTAAPPAPHESAPTTAHENPTTRPEIPAPTTAPTTAPPGSTTTIPTTTTTWPLGVPRDWPPGKPIPPMPPNCRQPQLEDNGVWNCDH